MVRCYHSFPAFILKLCFVTIPIIFVSCSSDTTDEASGSASDFSKVSISQAIVKNDFLKYISISDIEPKSDLFPQSNTQTPVLDLDSYSLESLQGVGFTLYYNTTASNVKGAYVQFLDTDGDDLGRYYQTPLNVSTLKGQEEEYIFTKRLGSADISNKSNHAINPYTYAIRVNTAKEIPLGTVFKVVIKLYDDKGNIGNPQYVDVTVVDWKVENSLAKKWTLDQEWYSTNKGVSYELLSSKNEKEFICDNGFLYAPYRDYQSRSLDLELSSDATLTTVNESTYYNLDHQLTQENCNSIYSTDLITRSYTGKGKWSYDNQTSMLTLVHFTQEEYYLEDLEQGVSNDVGYINSVDYPFGADNNKITASLVQGNLELITIDSDGTYYKQVYK